MVANGERKEIPQKRLKTFEEIKRVNADGTEYWSARELSQVLGYERWENFQVVIEKAVASCKTSGVPVQDHFRDVTKIVSLGSGGSRPINDHELSRYACYLIAQNGSPTKEAIAAAQMYFAVQTRKQETMSQMLAEVQRIEARKKLTETELRFAKTIFERGVDGPGIAAVRAKGDEALFGGNTTAQMRERINVPVGRPIADFLPTVSIKAKDLAAEITTVNTKQKDLRGRPNIQNEHVVNSDAVRGLLRQRGIVPELLPAEEDVKKIEKKRSQLEKMKYISENAKQAKRINDASKR